MGLTVDRSTSRVPTESPPLPALVVTFGSTQNKHRTLSKSATLIGRNRSCDIRLDAPEISGIHCILARHELGVSIRDCDSKSGVIVNGQPIRETELRDGDTIQIGPFSFVASIPVDAPRATSAPADSKLPASPDLENEIKCLKNHIVSVEAERDKLASQLHEALSERHRLQEQPSPESVASLETISELRRTMADISIDRDRWKDVAEEAKRQLAETSALSQSADDRSTWLEEEVERITQERNRFKADLEANEFSRQEAEKKSKESDQLLRKLQEQADEWTAERNRLTEERDSFRSELERWKSDQHDSQRQTSSDLEERERINQALVSQVEQLRAELEQSAQHRASLESELDELQGQRTEPSDVLERELQSSINKLQQERDALAEDLRYWQTQAEDSARKLTEIEATSGSIGSEAEELGKARSEVETLRQQLQEEVNQANQRLAAMRGELDRERSQMKQLVMQAAADHDRTQSELDRLREEHEIHQQTLAANPDDIHAELIQLRQRILELEGSSSPDLNSYEQQLNQYREELEAAQAELVARQEQLEKDNNDLMEKLRQSELDLSRDRAALARDRAEMERVRRELAAEMRHAEREASSKSKLAPVEQLAQELKGKQGPGEGTNASFSQRLQNLIRRVEDNHK